MAKKRGQKRKSEVKTEKSISDNDVENHETEEIENGDTDVLKTPGKKRKTLNNSVKSESENSNSTPSKSKGKSVKTKKEEKEDKTNYEVEKVIDVNNKKNNKREFLIRWKNYSAKHDTWEPEENLSCDELIAKFLEDLEKKAKIPRKDLRDKPKTTTRYAVPGARKSKRTAGNRKCYEEEDADNE